MPDTFKPRTEEEARDVVRWAMAEHEPLEIVGQASKRALGRPVQAGHLLDMSGLAGIELYEPEELVLTALPGTPIAEIEAALAASNQELAFDPLDYGPLLGNPAGQGTLGGVIAANLAGSKRLKHGAARDHVLGMDAVSGRGEIFHSGGRVVKNVTGYDLPRALTGSWGTLAVATRITLKVLPRAQTEATFLLSGLGDAEAATAMTTAMGSSAEVSAAAHLPAAAAQDLAARGHALSGPSTLLRLEGFGPSVDYRFERLRALLGAGRSVSRWRRMPPVPCGARCAMRMRSSAPTISSGASPSPRPPVRRSSRSLPVGSSARPSTTGRAASSGWPCRAPTPAPRRSAPPSPPAAAAMRPWCARPRRCALPSPCSSPSRPRLPPLRPGSRSSSTHTASSTRAA